MLGTVAVLLQFWATVPVSAFTAPLEAKPTYIFVVVNLLGREEKRGIHSIWRHAEMCLGRVSLPNESSLLPARTRTSTSLEIYPSGSMKNPKKRRELLYNSKSKSDY
jgi:hypothetical protein